jgi:hypothetical protein
VYLLFNLSEYNFAFVEIRNKNKESKKDKVAKICIMFFLIKILANNKKVPVIANIA